MHLPAFLYFLPIVVFLGAGCQPTAKKKNEVIDYSTEAMDVMVAECTICHGNREAQRGPILNGMEHWYLSDQINKFRSGIRGARPSNRSEHLMGVGVRKVSNDFQVAYLANWYSEQTPLPAIRTISGDIQKGKELYARRCASCHGPKGEGNRQLLSPSLSKLEGWYYMDQMRKFRSGERGYDYRDEGGQAMSAISKDLSDFDLRNLIAYSIDSFGLEEALPISDELVPAGSKKPF